ncbi:MAG: cysteine--tRNA ligase [Candidatus Eisenbacteria bacterium]|nr:cysteine--tRNA ligase [Candidatus Eisenbacteria bacterium]
MTLQVHDNLTRQKWQFIPFKDGQVGMYVCGMTVQDKPHLGHMFSSVAGDMLRRYLEYMGFTVTYLYNFTDIDDKIIEKAKAESVNYQVIALRNTEAYFACADLLNIKRASIYPRATEHIPEILELIRKLEEKNLAYASGTDVYYNVSRFKSYGKLSGKKIDELRAGARVEVGESKRNPLDFCLWKGAKEGEPFWESPWGKGRPGWHIECSAMSMAYLGETFDIHGGGQDLIFPHHENEIAQSEGATGKPFVNFWVENGLVNLTSEKMSKSTRHFIAADEILREFAPEAVRFYLLSNHYTSPIEFNEARLNEAGAALERLKNSMRRALELEESEAGKKEIAKGAPILKTIGKTKELFHESMEDDFNSAKAIGHLFELGKEVNLSLERGGDAPAIGAAGRSLQELGAILGLFWKEERRDVPPEVIQLARERELARDKKEWERADSIRKSLFDQGFILEDHAGGTRIRRK